MKNPKSKPRQPFLSRWPLAAGPLVLGALGQVLLVKGTGSFTAWAGFGLFLATFFLLQRSQRSGPGFPASLPWRHEAALFFLILGLALFLRIYRLGQFPAGIFPDQGNEAWEALRFNHEGWPSFSELLKLPVCVPSVYPFLTTWFKWFPATQLSLFLSSVFLSLLAFPFLYWIFRRLAGVPTALLALFFIAVMRWHLTYSRDAHPAVEVPFYLAGALAFWLEGVGGRRAWPFALGGAFLAAGFYSYQDLKALPLLFLVYAFYEWRWRPQGPEKNSFLAGTALFFLAFAVLASPLEWRMMQERSLGWREEELMAFPGLFQREGWAGVFAHLAGTLLAFNRLGDSWFYHNIPGHRLLDDVMGVLWVLGLLRALARLRERRHFYAVAGFLVLCLPAFLTLAPNHASRLFGIMPFIALFCGDALGGLAAAWSAHRKKFLPLLGVGLALGFCLAENFNDYFNVQARNEDCWRVDNGAEASWIGRAVAGDGRGYSFLVCPRFFGHYVIRFLAYGRLDRVFPLRIPQSLSLQSLPQDMGVCLALEQGQTGVLNLFQGLYPGGTLETLRSPSGSSVAYLYWIPPDQVAHKTLPKDWGLKGTYRIGGEGKLGQTWAQVDPVLNFTFRNDFSTTRFPPLWVKWQGWLKVEVAGDYRFVILTTDGAGLSIDGRKLLGLGSAESGDLFLGKGLHRLSTEFMKTSGVDAAFTLAWKKPGDGRYEPVPASALRLP